MIIHKVITGFVVQKFDTETRKFIDQEFIGSDDRDWETAEGDSLNLAKEPGATLVYGLGGVDEPYLNMEMVQPKTQAGVIMDATPLLAKATSFEVGEKVLVMPSGDPNDFVLNEFMGTVVGIKDASLVQVKDANDDVFDCDPIFVHHVK